jgi:hypothetical protein
MYVEGTFYSWIEILCLLKVGVKLCILIGVRTLSLLRSRHQNLSIHAPHDLHRFGVHNKISPTLGSVKPMGEGHSQNVGAGLSYCLILGHLFWGCPTPWLDLTHKSLGTYSTCLHNRRDSSIGYRYVWQRVCNITIMWGRPWRQSLWKKKQLNVAVVGKSHKLGFGAGW